MPADESGFTLLEAMTAIVILSMGMLAAYSWINLSIDSIVRSSEVFSQEALISEALQDVKSSNLNVTKDGTLQHGDLQVEWQVVPLETRSGVNNVGFVGLYDHTLHELSIEILNGGKPVGLYTSRVVSSDRVRNPRLEFQ